MRVLLLALLATAAAAIGVSAVHHPRPHTRMPQAQSPSKDGSVGAQSWVSFCPSGAGSGLMPATGVISGCHAYGFLDDQIMTTGWSYLHMESDPDLPSAEQAYAAGFGEGFLTAARIEQSFVNTIASSFTNGTIPDVVYTFIETQRQWVQAQYQADPSSPYWINAMFLYQQVEGLVDGCAAASPPYVITLRDALVLSMVAEAGDMQAATDLAYRASIDVLRMHDLRKVKAIMEKNSHCSALIRLSPDGQDMFSAHTTWTGYATMLRTYKYIAVNPTGTLARGIQFSSYPGSMSSIDDYYQTSAGLIVIETTNNIANVSLYDAVIPQSVPTFVRVMMASRMASSGSEFNDVYSQHNSGTYNNQWMISDNKQFTAGEPARAGTLWIVSQIPGLILSRDVTDVLTGQGYWPSYNIPYFPELWKLLGYESLVQQYGEYGTYLWDYEHSFRALIFARDAPNVKTIADMQAIIQENNWQTDPLSKGCAELAIAARMDLSSGPLGAAVATGAIDGKLSSASWMNAPNGAMQVLAKSGPSVETQAPFQWSTSAFNDQPHLGMPDKFDFDWQTFAVQQKPQATSEWKVQRVAVE